MARLRDLRLAKEAADQQAAQPAGADAKEDVAAERSEEHTSELQSLMRTSYAVFCLKKKKHVTTNSSITYTRTKLMKNKHVTTITQTKDTNKTSKPTHQY